jgi:hypothetical protein
VVDGFLVCELAPRARQKPHLMFRRAASIEPLRLLAKHELRLRLIVFEVAHASAGDLMMQVRVSVARVRGNIDQL